ncbi:conserved exported protein of unknown function [Pseudomonas marincola]|uniref:DUF2931 family protein n=1 Tax=Pseudomonas marincola TaxID=437900 RepID=A0A653E162_9PSED|nr:DUF2931 family protein [Pseudomonas marincola]CAE6936536.1 conserved exported protein of unknown function [Pseudomonas marincola]
MNRFFRLHKQCLALLMALLLSSCNVLGKQSMPYDAWRLGFFAPDYMEVWIETAEVVDINEHVFRGAGGGIASIIYPRPLAKTIPDSFNGKPKGWPENPGWGKGKYVRNADLPKKIYVRWQSMVEPQTYEAYIEIPESTREMMRNSVEVFCRADGKVITDYREAIVIGLAPGGIAKTWVTGPCLKPIEVSRTQATVDPRGPYEGKSNGHYRPLTDISKAYVEKFGIPYESW